MDTFDPVELVDFSLSESPNIAFDGRRVYKGLGRKLREPLEARYFPP